MAFSRSLIILTLIAGCLLPSGVQALWPIPTTLETGLTTLKISPAFYFDVEIEGAPSDLRDAVAQSQYYLENDKLRRLVVGRGANDTTAFATAMTLSKLTLSLASRAAVEPISSEAVKPLGTRSEEYALNIPADGSAATLTANSTLGLYRGLTTFNQLFYYYGGVTYTLLAPISIKDTPAYPFRGLGLDTSRHYYPVSDIQRTLDAMSWVKINTFHWHITDSQSFPLEVAQYPELAINGAYSPQEVYTARDVQYIVKYAAARGIDVMMEIDTPGHTAIMAAAYPEYVACFEASPWAFFSGEPPAGQLRFALPEVTNFTASLLTNIAKTLPSHYFSTGGDEINKNCYADDDHTQQQLKRTGMTLTGALDTFTQTTHGALIAQGKTPVVWEEMALDWNITLSNETIVMVWISSADAAAVVEKGFRIIQAPSDYFYLDSGAGEWLGDNPTGSSGSFRTWSEAYTFDPLANLTEAQYELVLGGEQILWSEQSGPQNVDPIVWPRAASSAEIFWSGKQPTGAALNVTEALPRLHDVRYRMVQRGVNAIPLQPQWCALRPDACDMYA
ncbi:glycoside hydrolase family 20 protein [Suillus tomentosus]|nr:glycoside hydrolase family 20 protein [Suillus tomentosus]